MARSTRSVPNPGDFVPYERVASGKSTLNWIDRSTGEIVSNRTIANSRHGGVSVERYRDNNKVRTADVEMVFKRGHPREAVAIVGNERDAVTSRAAVRRAILAMDPSRRGSVALAVLSEYAEYDEPEAVWRSMAVDTASMLRWLREERSLDDALRRSLTSSELRPGAVIRAIQVRAL